MKNIYAKIVFIYICSQILLISAGDLDEFILKLYKDISSINENKNVVISPVSIASVLAMGSFGMTSETKTEIDASLRGQKGFAISDSFKSLTNTIESDATIKSANKIYIKNGFTIKETFQQAADSTFHSKAESIDFSQPRKASMSINQWVSRETNGAFRDFIKPNGLTNTLMILLNVIYFKGSWVNAFEKPNEGDFYLNNVDKVKVNFMSNSGYFMHANMRDDKFQAIELPYNNTNIRMLLLLPHDKNGLKNLEGKLDENLLQKVFSSLHTEEVDVTLPKFKIDTETNLNEPLKRMGINKMFSDDAQLDNLVEEKAGLKVSAVEHRAMIDVNERGTVAAASTEMRVMFLCASCGPKYFTANRPFIFMLRNDDHIFFMGKVMNPKKA